MKNFFRPVINSGIRLAPIFLLTIASGLVVIEDLMV